MSARETQKFMGTLTEGGWGSGSVMLDIKLDFKNSKKYRTFTKEEYSMIVTAPGFEALTKRLKPSMGVLLRCTEDKKVRCDRTSTPPVWASPNWVFHYEAICLKNITIKNGSAAYADLGYLVYGDGVVYAHSGSIRMPDIGSKAHGIPSKTILV